MIREDKETILVVDDHEETTDLIKSILEDKGYKVLVSYNGEDAIRKVNKLKPDLAILDIMMPGLSGWDVYEKLKKNNNHKLKIVFL